MRILIDYFRRFEYRLNGFFLSEQDRLSLWLPVAFGAGIGFYFNLPAEPLLTTTLCLFAGAVFLLWDTRKEQAHFLAFSFLFLFAAGIFFTQLRTFALSAPRIRIRTGLLTVTGTVQDVAALSDGRNRLVLKDVGIKNFSDRQTPAKLELTLSSDLQPPQTGDLIETATVLSPPRTPDTPTGFDFSRRLYFQGIGAQGFTQEKIKILKRSESSRIRETINKRIDLLLPPDTAGIAKALITGNAKSIPPAIAQNYRAAGIAHILAVSGLHMSLLAGLVFTVTRTVLALIPAIALYRNTKKIAATVALLVCFGYLQISGASYAAQRAFVMTAFLLTAILFNRRALSVVSLAWAAFLILLFSPESVFSAGFQLSFAAATALICAYEAGIDKYIRLLKEKESLCFSVFSCFAAIVLTTLTASFATAPFAVFHFKQLPVYSLVGNLLSSSITGFWVMPSLTAGTVLMPLGWEKPFFLFASCGISLINKAAQTTANLPYAVFRFPPMPFYGLMLAVFGGLWFCLWQGKHRYCGLAVFCFSLATPFFNPLPDMYVSSAAAAFRNKDGLLVFKEGTVSALTKKAWLEENGQDKELTTVCPYGFCLYERNGVKIGYAHSKVGAYDACQRTDLDALFLTVKFKYDCKTKRVFTQEDISNAGVYTLYTKPELKLESVTAAQGFRPWTLSYPTLTLSNEWNNLKKPHRHRIKAALKEKD